MSNRKVFHIYKGDHNKSSRIISQCSLIKSEMLSSTTTKKLNLKNLRKILNKNDVYIFHCQSSLIYLFFSLFFLNTCQVRYDIHDYNEYNFSKGFYFNFRVLVLSFFEYCLIPFLRICNVSNGNKFLYNNKGYVFKNVPLSNEFLNTHEKTKSFVFFGTTERCPFSLFPKFSSINSDNPSELSIYGMFDDRILKYAKDNNISYFGEYSPLDMSFLSSYKFSLIYHPSTKLKNMRNSLPNKFFQSIQYNLNICVSENFAEIINFCKVNNIPCHIIDEDTDFASLKYVPYEFDFESFQRENNLEYLKFVENQ